MKHTFCPRCGGNNTRAKKIGKTYYCKNCQKQYTIGKRYDSSLFLSISRKHPGQIYLSKELREIKHFGLGLTEGKIFILPDRKDYRNEKKRRMIYSVDLGKFLMSTYSEYLRDSDTLIIFFDELTLSTMKIISKNTLREEKLNKKKDFKLTFSSKTYIRVNVDLKYHYQLNNKHSLVVGEDLDEIYFGFTQEKSSDYFRLREYDAENALGLVNKLLHEKMAGKFQVNKKTAFAIHLEPIKNENGIDWFSVKKVTQKQK